jgi:hypothetical protein
MHILLRGGITQRLRIATGLILFTFATTHFLNHALGLISHQTLAEGRTIVSSNGAQVVRHQRTNPYLNLEPMTGRGNLKDGESPRSEGPDHEGVGLHHPQ